MFLWASGPFRVVPKGGYGARSGGAASFVEAGETYAVSEELHAGPAPAAGDRCGSQLVAAASEDFRGVDGLASGERAVVPARCRSRLLQCDATYRGVNL